MGFFSSRRPEEDYVPDDKHTVVQVIRSRFYGRNKGKERELPERPKTVFLAQDTPAAQTLSHPTSSESAHPIRHAASIPFLGPRKPSLNSIRESDNARSFSLRLKPSAPTNPTSQSSASLSNPPSSWPSSTETSRTSESHNSTAYSTISSTSSSSPRKLPDSVTTTLAQRLNELAVANSEGLLNDDEYRALRQNLFERFASSTTVPTENPVVPATPIKRNLRGPSEGRASTSSRPSSNFFVDVPRSPSIRSKTSIRSGVASLFRAASRRTGSRDHHDTASVFSGISGTSTSHRPNPLQKKSSSTSVRSIRTDASHQTDTMSTAGRRTERILYALDSPHTPSRASVGSRRVVAPPSSFPRTSVAEKYPGNVRDVFDTSTLQTSRDIQQELEAIEGERKRLMDAFNGLELTSLAKRQRRPNRARAGSRPSTIVVDNLDRSVMKMASTTTLTPDSPSSHLRVLGGESDVISIRSGTSVGTTLSMSRSIHSKTLPSKTSNSLLNNSPSRGSLHRKNSSGSVSSGRALVGKGKQRVPPVPVLPSHLGKSVHASSSSVNLTRSTGHLPMSSLPEDEDGAPMEVEDIEFEAEMEDIRRKREEVSQRYEARLEYLRAKLKGAQLHEKLMKK
ncbi:hypothetical protein E1B28_012573 [Marasmius oreades]|uniref:Uncharacterized protein n=1 Tax=Marasmius oreades TaxID=181124 RepID=A0A9P7RRV5_9AGAR|nr:uncharacterized protein E1B28_012573 [Marasmius oreades]KAG7088599.1 hypothetical protein E1B28_012573 [Marasmius oreades]